MTHTTKVIPDWRDEVRIGDILRNKKSGAERVVRGVSFNQYGRIRFVDFTIMNCSWTHRCTTTRTRTDMNQFEPTCFKKTTINLIDKFIALEIRETCNINRKRRLDCCSVKGVR